MTYNIYRFILDKNSDISIYKNDKLYLTYKRKTFFFRNIECNMYDSSNTLLLHIKMKAFFFNNLKIIENNLGLDFRIKNNFFVMIFKVNETEKFTININKIFHNSMLIANVINNRKRFSLEYDFDIKFNTDNLIIEKQAIIFFVLSKTNLNLY